MQTYLLIFMMYIKLQFYLIVYDDFISVSKYW